MDEGEHPVIPHATARLGGLRGVVLCVVSALASATALAQRTESDPSARKTPRVVVVRGVLERSIVAEELERSLAEHPHSIVLFEVAGDEARISGGRLEVAWRVAQALRSPQSRPRVVLDRDATTLHLLAAWSVGTPLIVGEQAILSGAPSGPDLTGADVPMTIASRELAEWTLPAPTEPHSANIPDPKDAERRALVSALTDGRTPWGESAADFVRWDRADAPTSRLSARSLESLGLARRVNDRRAAAREADIRQLEADVVLDAGLTAFLTRVSDGLDAARAALEQAETALDLPDPARRSVAVRRYHEAARRAQASLEAADRAISEARATLDRAPELLSLPPPGRREVLSSASRNASAWRGAIDRLATRSETLGQRAGRFAALED